MFNNAQVRNEGEDEEAPPPPAGEVVMETLPEDRSLAKDGTITTTTINKDNEEAADLKNKASPKLDTKYEGGLYDESTVESLAPDETEVVPQQEYDDNDNKNNTNEIRPLLPPSNSQVFWKHASSKVISFLNINSTDSTQQQEKPPQLKIDPGQDLVSDPVLMRSSFIALQINVACNALNTKLLNPNFAIMAMPGAHPDSFENTNPFSFNSATYFLPLSSLMGVALGSAITGRLSDRYGRKLVLQACTLLAGVGSMGMYLAKDTFWGFCGASFAAGLFKGTLPVAMGYIGDVFTASKKEKQDQLSFVVGCYVLGNSGGGIFSILMEDTGLFAPLLLGAGFVFISFVINMFYFIEPSKQAKYVPVGKDKLISDIEKQKNQRRPTTEDNEQDDNDVVVRPETINEKLLWWIIAGAFADNVGSTALFPLCLSPLALEQYFRDFVNANQDPIMSMSGYKWLSVCVALMVIPGTMVTPAVFGRVGAAGGCVFGNICTGILTLALLLIGNGSATTAMFGLFVVIMYGGFPFTVVSQLSTGPMLDLIAPEEKIGYAKDSTILS